LFLSMEMWTNIVYGGWSLKQSKQIRPHEGGLHMHLNGQSSMNRLLSINNGSNLRLISLNTLFMLFDINIMFGFNGWSMQVCSHCSLPHTNTCFMFDHLSLEFKPLLLMHLEHLLHNHILHQSITSITNFGRCCWHTTIGSISKYGSSLQQEKRNLIRSNKVNNFTIKK
jgi:hypothetical protein